MFFRLIEMFLFLNVMLLVFRLIRYAFAVNRFLSFAKTDFYETWEYLTSYKKLGSGFQINPFRSFVFFSQNEECEEAPLEQARKQVKGRLVSAFLALGGVAGSFLLLVGYAIFQSVQR